jgi:hypothetical protein
MSDIDLARSLAAFIRENKGGLQNLTKSDAHVWIIDQIPEGKIPKVERMHFDLADLIDRLVKDPDFIPPKESWYGYVPKNGLWSHAYNYPKDGDIIEGQQVTNAGIFTFSLPSAPTTRQGF